MPGRSKVDHCGNDGEDCVQGNDANNPGDDGAGSGTADIGGAPPGFQANAATGHTNQGSKGDAFDEAEHELVQPHSRGNLIQETDTGDGEHRNGDHEPAENANQAPVK